MTINQMKEYAMKTVKTERGQSLVELSISLVILLWLLAGAVEFGLAFFQFIQLRDAAQEGALYGSINPTDSTGIKARVLSQSTSPIDLIPEETAGTVTVAQAFVDDAGDPSSGCITEGIKVTVTYDHNVFMPFATLFTGGDTVTISASVTDTILVDDIC